MGGAVGLDSAPGKGSTFRVRLPLKALDTEAATEHARTAEQDAQSEPEKLSPRKILIVEDNRINLVVLRDLLEQEGHEVDEAHDGEQGVAFARQTVHDLVFMDISMPVLDGVEATRAIRQSEARGTRLPIIALTAHALPADRERFRAAGLDDILVKPISRNGVRATLATFLGKGAAHPPAPAQNAASLLDSAHLDSLAETLGPEKTDAIVNEFIAEMTTAVADISHRLETGDAGGAKCLRGDTPRRGLRSSDRNRDAARRDGASRRAA